MKREEYAKAIDLRKEGKAVGEIAKILGVSKSSASLWVRKVELTEGQKLRLLERSGPGRIRASEVIAEKYRNLRKEYQQQGRRMAKESDKEFAMGCMLFWAEGAKARGSASLCNTDVDLLKFFMGFMRKYFGVKDEEVGIRVLCHLDNGMGLDEIHRYWLDQLKLPVTCLRSATIRNLGTLQKRRHKYGVCTIQVNDVVISQKLWGAIQELIGCDRPEWLD